VTLSAPRTDQPHYGEHLGDAGYWGEYVRAVLEREELPRAEIEAPFVGTFPTFLVGGLVVKLFGETFDGGDAFAAELAMGELLAGVPEVPAPAVVAHGRLFDGSDGWSWPYLIMERLTARAARDVPSGPSLRPAAKQLGPALARLHTLTAPPTIAARDPLPALRAEAPARLRGFGLPAHLADQVPDFLADAPAERVLVHADVTADHVFVDDDGLVGIIDWADAITADPWYELVALRFDALRGDPDLFAILLDSYDWPRSDDFGIRTLQGVLEFQFDAITAIARTVDLDRLPTLHHLADHLSDPR
jgi:hygromycin-B 7''-O-kinase